MGKKNDLLIDDDELLVLQSKLAVIVGDRRAIALQQIHYWMGINEKAKKTDHLFDDAWWVYNTWREWQETNFKFWSIPTIRRIFADLEMDALIITRPHDDPQKGLWVTINYGRLQEMLGKFEEADRPKVHRRASPDHFDQGGVIKMIRGGSQTDQGLGDTETNAKTTNKKKEIAPNGDPPILQSEEGLPDPETPTPPKVLTEKQAARAALNAAVKFVFRVEEMSPVNLANWGNFFTGQVQENGSKGRRMGDWFEHQILPGMTLDEIHAFGMWCGKPPFRKCSELNIEVNQFRADPRHDGMVERARLDREAREDLAARQAAGGDDQPQPAPDADGQYNPDVAARFAAMVQAVGNKFAAGGKKS